MIGIDPGVKKVALAETSELKFNYGQLIRVQYDPPDKIEFDISEQDVWIEMPRIYPGSGQTKGDLNDLLDLSVVVGQMSERARGLTWNVKLIYPRDWKGNVPKAIMTTRILSKLTAEERSLIPTHAKAHNIVDAVGICLAKLGRL